jgi:hypothetical protein
VVSDYERVYITGRAHQFALAPRKTAPRKAGAARERRKARAER